MVYVNDRTAVIHCQIVLYSVESQNVMQRLRNIPVHSDGSAGNLIRNIDFPFIKCDVERIRLRCGKLHQRLLDQAVPPTHSELQNYQAFPVIFPDKILLLLHFLLEMTGLEKRLTVCKVDGQRAAASGTAWNQLRWNEPVFFSFRHAEDVLTVLVNILAATRSTAGLGHPAFHLEDLFSGKTGGDEMILCIGCHNKAVSAADQIMEVFHHPARLFLIAFPADKTA